VVSGKGTGGRVRGGGQKPSQKVFTYATPGNVPDFPEKEGRGKKKTSIEKPGIITGGGGCLNGKIFERHTKERKGKGGAETG